LKLPSQRTNCNEVGVYIQELRKQRLIVEFHGVEIISTWIDWDRNRDDVEPTSDEWREHSEECLIDAANCDVLLLVAFEDERQFGALLETGAALGADWQVFCVAPHAA
jgi:hypothetical protein